jgi:periplasmic protein TonB
MFLEKSAARLLSFVLHSVGVATLATLPTPVRLPPIDPPCAEIMTWMPARPPAPPAPPAVTSGQHSGFPGQMASPLIQDDAAPVADEPHPLETGGSPFPERGICGCGVSGGIVEGLAEWLPGILVPPLESSALPSALPSSPLRAGDDVAIPAKLVDVAPRYPPLARRARMEGVVTIDATIDELGRVVDARVLRSVTAFDAAAIDAVRQWRYAPATQNGLPVRVMLTVTVAFTLPG